MNENENTTTQNLWDTVKAVLRGRFIALQAYLKKQINNLTLHLQQLEKGEMKKPRVSRRKEILKIRVEINAKETKQTRAKINKVKSCFFFEKIKLTNRQQDLLRNKGRRSKLTKLEMKMERSQQTSLKYKGS